MRICVFCWCVTSEFHRSCQIGLPYVFRVHIQILFRLVGRDQLWYSHLFTPCQIQGTLARELHQRIELYKRSAQFYYTKLWSVPMVDISSIYADIQAFGAQIPSRVRISLSLREIATQIESGNAKFEYLLGLTRFWVFAFDAYAVATKLTPRFCDCEMSTQLRFTLFKEAFVRTFLAQRIQSKADVGTADLLSDFEKIDGFMDTIAQAPIVDEDTNTLLADFVQAATAVRFLHHCFNR